MKLREIKAQAQKRRAQLAKLRAKGMTLEEIAEKIGVTKQRVFQLLSSRK